MRSVVIHFRHASLIAVAGFGLILAMAGCWREIEYVRPDPTASTAASATPSDDAQAASADAPPDEPVIPAAQTSDVATEASGFGDELSASLASQSPVTEGPEADASRSDEGERYGTEDPRATARLPHELPASADAGETAGTTDALLGRSLSEAAPPADQTPETTESAPGEASLSTDLPPNAVDASDMRAPQSINTRLAAWQLGSKLSLAALANDRGVAADKVERWLAGSQTVAAALNIAYSDLPPTGAAGQSGNPSRDVLNYLFQQSAQLSRQLTDGYGADHAALYEVAVKSNLLLVLYQPGSSTTGAIAAAIRDAAPRAKLPEAVVKPLLELVSTGAQPADVRKHVQRLHAQVEKYLGQRVER